MTIDAFNLAKVIIDIIVWQYGLSNSIVSYRGSVFTLKSWSSLYYFITQDLLFDLPSYMTSARDFHPFDFTSKIIWLNTFLEFLSCSLTSS